MGSPLEGRMTRPKRQRCRPFTIDCGPFVGMRDSVDPAASDPLRATLLQNVYPDGAAVVGRPGYDIMGTSLGVEVQWVGQFTTLGGVEYTVAVAGGELYTYNWGGDAWTKVVTTANLATASITLNTSGRVSGVVFANKLVVADFGGNTPFTWDGTSGAGGLTKLTACPALYGPPVVYYGKLFGIKMSDRATIVWSEEADPTTGYEAGGLVNRWTLGQTDTARLTALLATNEALYVFRERSIAAIHGAVTDDFQTTGTRADISESVGTESPWAIAVAEGGAYFLDADGRPHVLALGGGVTPIWYDLEETTRELAGVLQVYASAVYDVNLHLVRFGVLLPLQSESTKELCYAPGSRTPVAVFTGYSSRCMGVVKDASGRPRIAHGMIAGSLYAHGTPDAGPWFDEVSAGAFASIAHVVQGPYIGHDVAEDKLFTRLDATLHPGQSVLAVDVDYETPYEQSTAQTVSVTTGGTWSEPVVRVGINAQGRWIRPRIAHDSAEFGLSRIRVSGVTRSDEPNAR